MSMTESASRFLQSIFNPVILFSIKPKPEFVLTAIYCWGFHASFPVSSSLGKKDIVDFHDTELTMRAFCAKFVWLFSLWILIQENLDLVEKQVFGVTNRASSWHVFSLE